MPCKLYLLDKSCKKWYLFSRPFAISTNAYKRTGKIKSPIFPNWLKKATVNALLEGESNPYPSCQGAALKGGHVSHTAGSLHLVPEGYGIGLQNVYRKKNKPKPRTNNITKIKPWIIKLKLFLCWVNQAQALYTCKITQLNTDCKNWLLAEYAKHHRQELSKGAMVCSKPLKFFSIFMIYRQNH